MFKKDLGERLRKLLGVTEVTFNAPADEAREQNIAFVQVESQRGAARAGVINLRVQGKISIFADSKMPYGYFQTKWQKADSAVKRPLLLYQESVVASGRYVELAIHEVSFVFFYNGPYDPNQGEINELEISGGIENE